MVEAERLCTALLAGYVVAGALSVAAALIGAHDAALQSSCVAFAALAGLAASASDAVPPKVRWSLAGAMVVFCLADAAELAWQTALPELTGSELAGGSAGVQGALQEYARVLIDTQRSIAVLTLLAILLLGVAVRAVPRKGGLVPALLVGVLALVPMATNVGGLLDSDDVGAFLSQIGAEWSALAAMVAAGVVAVRAGWRVGQSWLLPAGALLLVVTAATGLHDLAVQWSIWYVTSGPGAAVMFTAAATAVSAASPWATTASLTDPWAAVAAATALGGPALLMFGTLRGSRTD